MPDKVVRFTKVDLPDDGQGIFTHLERYKYPYKGYPDEKIVFISSAAKRTLVATIKLFVRNPLNLLIPFFVLFLALPPVRKRFIYRFLGWFGEVCRTAYINTKYWHPTEHPKRLCRSGREIYRVLNSLFSDPNDPNTVYADCIIGVCMMWEFDNAYRYRGQDLFACLNKERLAKNPRKEILRILKIAIERETSYFEHIKGTRDKFDLRDKWNLLYAIVWTLTILSPSFVKTVKRILLEMNLEEVCPDEGDWYWMCERDDYNFGGLSHEARHAIRKAIDEEYWKTLPPPKDAVAELRLMPSPNFFALSKEKAEELVKGVTNQLWEAYEKNKVVNTAQTIERQ